MEPILALGAPFRRRFDHDHLVGLPAKSGPGLRSGAICAALPVDRDLTAIYFTAMAKRPLILIPDPILRRPAVAVERVDGELRQLADDMLATMYAAPGIGLAAPQVGVSRRVIVLDVSDKDDDAREPRVMINPQIVASGSERRAYEEGCLSIPDVKVEVERPTEINVTYLDRDGVRQSLRADGLLATVIQH